MPTALSRAPRWLGPAALQATKTAIAAGLSWFVAANVLRNNLPVFAPLAALLTVQVTLWESVSRGLQRVVGVVVGVAIGLLLKAISTTALVALGIPALIVVAPV